MLIRRDLVNRPYHHHLNATHGYPTNSGYFIRADVFRYWVWSSLPSVLFLIFLAVGIGVLSLLPGLRDLL